MKKLMIAAAIVCAAAITQAAQLGWGDDTVFNALNADGGVILSSGEMKGNIVLAYLGTSDSWGYGSAVKVGVGESDISGDGEYANFAGTLTSSYTGTGALAAGNVYAVMFEDSEGALYQLKNADGSLNTTTYTVDASYDTKWSKSFSFTDSDYLATSASYVTVPEPTSGLLLLLGVAGLALRRRRA